jgi:hypothetical protein
MVVEDYRLYKAILDLIGREANANPTEMSSDSVAHILIALLAKVINSTPVERNRAEMTYGALHHIVESIGKNLPEDFFDDEVIDTKKLN